MLRVSRNEESKLRSSQRGSPQAVFVFQITDMNTHPFPLTVDKLERAPLEARLQVSKGQCVQGAPLPPKGVQY